MVRSEALAHCKAIRIAEVERQCRARVAAIEEHYQQRLKNILDKREHNFYNTLS